MLIVQFYVNIAGSTFLRTCVATLTKDPSQLLVDGLSRFHSLVYSRVSDKLACGSLGMARTHGSMTHPCAHTFNYIPKCIYVIEYRPPSIIGRVYKICALLEQLLLVPKCSPNSQTLVEK